LQSRTPVQRLQALFLHNAPVKVISLAVAVVIYFVVRITSLEERFVTVPLEARLAEGFIVTSDPPSTARVTLRGEGDAIFRVVPEDIAVFVDLEQYTTEGVFRVPVRFEKLGQAGTVDPLEVRVEPQEVTITIERVIERTVRVSAVIGAMPPHGFELEDYAVNPSSVLISGARRVVQDVQALPTQPVDLSDSREDVSLRVELDYDAQELQLPGGSLVEFSARIMLATTFRTFEGVEIIAVDLRDELTIGGPLPPGSITLQGSVLALDGLSGSSLALELDCSGVSAPGEQMLGLLPRTPPGLVVLDYGPREIRVGFRRKIAKP
jgi:hypothetical protein